MKTLQSLLAIGLTGTFAAMAPAQAQETCLPISGGINVTVVGSEPLRVLGPVTGTLAGATQATVLSQAQQGDGTIRLDVTHDFVTDDRSSLTTRDVVIWTPVSGHEGVFRMQTTYTIVSGTGRFAEAHGSFNNHGEVVAGEGLVTLSYGGEICGVN